MAGTGGLAGQLPLRLGVVDNSGLDTSDHARLCADLAACMRTVPTLRMRVSRSGTTYTVEAFRSIYTEPAIYHIGGKASFYLSPTRTLSDGTVVTGCPRVWVATSGGPSGAAEPVVYVTNYYSVDLIQISIADGATAELTGWGSDLDARTIADYGGALDKEDCQAERVPYAWTAYRMLQDARGSSYSKELSGLVHVENQALARAHAARWRDCERLSANANPATAHEKAEEWRQALAVRLQPNDTPESLRTRCAAKFLAARGPTRQTVDDAVEKLLGQVYVKSWRLYGTDLDNPPTETYWPGVNPGIPSYDLGGGPWYSERSHIVIEVTQPADVSLASFLDKMAQLYELLDRMLPATSTFDWAVNVDDGFELDVDQMDFGALSRV